MKAVAGIVAGIVMVGGIVWTADQGAASPETQPTTAPSTQASAKPVNKFCAVEHENEIDLKHGGTYLYKGKTIGFCCPDCIDEFKKDPEKYVKNMK